MTMEHQEDDRRQPEEQLITHRQVQITQFEGPLPPPDDLQAYESILPGVAERIVGMAEGQIAHRQDIERKEAGRASLGIYSGTALAFAVLGLAGYALYLGESTIAAVLGVADLVGLAGVYVFGTRARGPR